MIAFLRDQVESVSVSEPVKILDDKGEVTDGPTVTIEFDVPVIDSSMEARLLDLARFAYLNEGKQKYLACQLENCVKGDVIKVNGEEISAKKLAKYGDLAEPVTSGILTIISREIDANIFVSEDDKKKSKRQQKPQ